MHCHWQLSTVTCSPAVSQKQSFVANHRVMRALCSPRTEMHSSEDKASSIQRDGDMLTRISHCSHIKNPLHLSDHLKLIMWSVTSPKKVSNKTVHVTARSELCPQREVYDQCETKKTRKVDFQRAVMSDLRHGLYWVAGFSSQDVLPSSILDHSSKLPDLLHH